MAKVRNMQLSDADAMLRLSLATRLDTYLPLLTDAYRLQFEQDHLYTELHRKSYNDHLNKYLNKTSISCLVVENDSNVCGYVKFQHRPGYILITNLYINPTEQGRGYGKELLSSVESTSGACHLKLDVAVTNKKAIRFYEHLGFTKEKLLKKTYYGLSMQRMTKYSKIQTA
ncbi:MAG: GNAT family N-acetyltransferase [Candidatus Microsaccharimonas sp.]